MKRKSFLAPRIGLGLGETKLPTPRVVLTGLKWITVDSHKTDQKIENHRFIPELQVISRKYQGYDCDRLQWEIEQ